MTEAIIICMENIAEQATALLEGMGAAEIGSFSAARWHDAAGQAFACATIVLSDAALDLLRSAAAEADSPLRLIEAESLSHDFDWAASDRITVLTDVRGDVALALMGLQQVDIAAIM